MGNLKICTINLPNRYIDCLDILKDQGFFPSRSEAVRQALKVFLGKEAGFIKDIEPEVFGNLKEIHMNCLIGSK